MLHILCSPAGVRIVEAVQTFLYVVLEEVMRSLADLVIYRLYEREHVIIVVERDKSAESFLSVG